MNDIIFKTINMDGTPMKRREENVHKQNNYDGVRKVFFTLIILFMNRTKTAYNT